MIDVVVPYVDFKDKNWIELAKKTGIDYSETNRFRSQGEFFRYFFRCIDKNLPWVHNIFLIVQSWSQVPKWLNTKNVKIVLHKDIIPEEFLPTYNSCTIEMFLGNIKELNEKFLYFNDDIFILNRLQPEDFFVDDKVCINFIGHFPYSIPFSNHCKNGFYLIFDEDAQQMTPEHTVKPLLKSQILECYEKYKEQIYKSISRLRETKNINGYVWTYYLLNKGRCTDSNVTFGYTCKYDSRLLLHFKTKDVICIGDETPKLDVYSDKRLNKKFNTRFNNKSKYEL